jgi:thiol-disulfide isomerase/thioredoxin
MALAGFAAAAGRSFPDAPEFPTQDPMRWVGPPTRLAELRGRVVMLEVWTFECINCARTAPWVKETVSRYGERGLSVVGVHTPEFPREHDRDSVAAAVRQHGFSFPSLLDNDMAYWNALGNEYWPAIYLVDRCGKLRFSTAGEVHRGEPSGRRVETKLEELLAETQGTCAPR